LLLISLYLNHSAADNAVIWSLYRTGAGGTVPVNNASVGSATDLFDGQGISPTNSGTVYAGLHYVDDLTTQTFDKGLTVAYFIAYRVSGAGTATLSNGTLSAFEIISGKAGAQALSAFLGNQ
jgi:hypothetical protein